MSAAEQTVEPAEPRRLTPTERLHEVTLAAIQRPASPPEHSVSLTLNAKGDVQIEVTGRGHDLAALIESTRAEFDALRLHYPRAGEGVGGPVASIGGKAKP